MCQPTISILALDAQFAVDSAVNQLMEGAVPPRDQLATVARHHCQTCVPQHDLLLLLNFLHLGVRVLTEVFSIKGILLLTAVSASERWLEFLEVFF